jgi:thiamine pyrophosphokinase
MNVIVNKSGPILLVGGGEAPVAEVQALARQCVAVVAADGGADAALGAGLVPDAVIGDLDSLSAQARLRIPAPQIHVVAEQESTDFEKALCRTAAPLVLAHGFMGARRDHELANFNTLVRHPHRACILLGSSELVLHVPPHLHVDVPLDTRVSVFPMAAVRARSRGLVWPLDGLDLAPWGRVGTSNRAQGAFSISPQAPGLLLLLPRSCLDAVVKALAVPGPAWPAPAA